MPLDASKMLNFVTTKKFRFFDYKKKCYSHYRFLKFVCTFKSVLLIRLLLLQISKGQAHNRLVAEGSCVSQIISIPQ